MTKNVKGASLEAHIEAAKVRAEANVRYWRTYAEAVGAELVEVLTNLAKDFGVKLPRSNGKAAKTGA